jgi:hypothetical protein
MLDVVNRSPVDHANIDLERADGHRQVAAAIATDPTRRLVVFNGAAAAQFSPTKVAENGTRITDVSLLPTSGLSAEDVQELILTELQATGAAFVCAEPPPDTAMNVLSATTAAIKAAADLQGRRPKGNGERDPEDDAGNAADDPAAGGNANFGASISDSLTQVAVSLATRTELVEVYRAALYSLCQLHMNGAMTSTDAAKVFQEITSAAIRAAGEHGRISPTSVKASDTLRNPEPPEADKKPPEPEAPEAVVPTTAATG